MTQNKLIVMDGQNKAGKGMQVRLLAGRLRSNDIQVATEREPGGGEMGESIRSILLSDIPRQPETSSLLFNAARRETVVRIGKLLTNQWVVADRSYLSTLAFQIHGEGAPDKSTRELCKYALAGEYQPDAFFVLDIDWETYVKRKQIEDEKDYFERDKDFFNRVREGFLVEGQKIGAFIIDATRSVDAVAEDVWEKVTPLV